MTVAVRLRCTCRRTVATLDHGADHFVITERERYSFTLYPRPWLPGAPPIDPDLALVMLSVFRPVDLNRVVITCSKCHGHPRFSTERLADAIRRSQVTGRPVDIDANP